MATKGPDPAKLRSVYRSLLRELPPRPILARPRIPIHSQLRKLFIYRPQTQATPTERIAGLALAEQIKAYLQAQRHYVSLIEQYNPGMGMSQEERVRLSARRVGMDLPSQFEVVEDPNKKKRNECKQSHSSDDNKVAPEYNVDEYWMAAGRLRSIDRHRMAKKEKGTKNFQENKRRQKYEKFNRLLSKTDKTDEDVKWLENEMSWARKRAEAAGDGEKWQDYL